MKLAVWLVVLGAVGFGVYWFVIRPRRQAAAMAAGTSTIRSAIGQLRAQPMPLAVN